MKGFTLLEMLVVVLIIGILVSVAMPQYQRAVERSRAIEAITIARSMIAAQNRSLDAFPNLPVDNRAALDVTFSDGTWSPAGDTAEYQDTYQTSLFTYTLRTDGVEVTRRVDNQEYTLRFYNKNSQLRDSCAGANLCANMAEMGFVNNN